MISTNPTVKAPLLSGIAVLCALLACLLIPAQSEACSINAGGTCGGSPCPEGESCKKVSDYECKCVKDSDDVKGWPTCEPGEKHCQVGIDDWICWPATIPCPVPVAARERDMPDCELEKKHCQIGADDWICWPTNDDCPNPGVKTEEVGSAFFFVVSNPQASAVETLGTQEVTLSVSGCSGCFNSALVTMPGDVTGVAHLSSDFSGGVNSSGIHWLGNTVWETACFGNSAGSCGSVRRTYLIAY